jgi:hypothetical protein
MDEASRYLNLANATLGVLALLAKSAIRKLALISGHYRNLHLLH